MVREHGLQRANRAGQIATEQRHVTFNLGKKRLGSPCFTRMEFEIRRAAEDVQPGIEFLIENGSIFIMRRVCGSSIGEQHRERIVMDPMVAKKIEGLGGRILHEQIHTERAARTGAWQQRRVVVYMTIQDCNDKTAFIETQPCTAGAKISAADDLGCGL